MSHICGMMHLRKKMLSTHEIADKVAPIVMLKDCARIMKENAKTPWLIRNSHRIADKVKNMYIVTHKKHRTPQADRDKALTEVEQKAKEGKKAALYQTSERSERLNTRRHEWKVEQSQTSMTRAAVVPVVVAPNYASKENDATHEERLTPDRQKAA